MIIPPIRQFLDPPLPLTIAEAAAGIEVNTPAQHLGALLVATCGDLLNLAWQCACVGKLSSFRILTDVRLLST